MIKWKILVFLITANSCYAADDKNEGFNPYPLLGAFYKSQSSSQPSPISSPTSTAHSYPPSYTWSYHPNSSHEMPPYSASTPIPSAPPESDEEDTPDLQSSEHLEKRHPIATDFSSTGWQVIHEESPEEAPKTKSTSALSYQEQRQLLLPQEKKASSFEELHQQVVMLQEKNKILEELLRLAQLNHKIGIANQEQLSAISEALGIKFEQSEKNQELISHNVEMIKDKLSKVTKEIKDNKKSTLYMVYHTIQGGVQLAQAGMVTMATFKTLSLLPAFVIPGWAVYVSAAAAGAFVYLAKL